MKPQSKGVARSWGSSGCMRIQQELQIHWELLIFFYTRMLFFNLMIKKNKGSWWVCFSLSGISQAVSKTMFPRHVPLLIPTAFKKNIDKITSYYKEPESHLSANRSCLLRCFDVQCALGEVLRVFQALHCKLSDDSISPNQPNPSRDLSGLCVLNHFSSNYCEASCYSLHLFNPPERKKEQNFHFPQG